MADAQRAHDAILRGTIERHGGYVFGAGGDGFRAAFSTAGDAAAAAIEAQEQLRDDTVVDFAVRMGLHTGEAIERDRNYSGSEVNRAARLMSLAHGGQVLVSDTTEVLLRNRMALRPLGEHRLRGLGGRISVYQIVADGLPTEFPVLRSVDYFTGNLPQQLSTLVGREQVGRRGRRAPAVEPAGHADRRRRGRQDPAGARGRGRGRRRVPGRRVDGRAGLGRRPGVGPGGDRQRVGRHPTGRHGRSSTRSPTRSRGRQLLLVIDNCEHVLAAAGSAIAAILGRSESVKILATSRETLSGGGRRDGARRRRRWRWTGARPPMPSRCSSTAPGPSGPTSGSGKRRPRPR